MNSTRSIWSMVSPAYFMAFLVAGTGPRPITWGFTPATPNPIIRAKGSRPNARAFSSLMTKMALTPSLVGDEFPGVMTISLPP